jgi:hypothetical protein
LFNGEHLRESIALNQFQMFTFFFDSVTAVRRLESGVKVNISCSVLHDSALQPPLAWRRDGEPLQLLQPWVQNISGGSLYGGGVRPTLIQSVQYHIKQMDHSQIDKPIIADCTEEGYVLL